MIADSKPEEVGRVEKLMVKIKLQFCGFPEWFSYVSVMLRLPNQNNHEPDSLRPSSVFNQLYDYMRGKSINYFGKTI